jgi:hypothetical protein
MRIKVVTSSVKCGLRRPNANGGHRDAAHDAERVGQQAANIGPSTSVRGSQAIADALKFCA